MSEAKRYVCTVSGQLECGDDPDYVEVFVDEPLARRVVELAQAVRKLGVLRIEEFDYHCNWYRQPEEDADFDEDTGLPKVFQEVDEARTECDCLVVHAEEFGFTAYPKHCDNEICTARWSVKELAEHFGLEFKP